ncbi:MAG: glucosaminidase domain-containing protein [Saprospiraceae bacterium]|nr:glucosaminidase domain-containing protein [Lewinella sp.]
MRLSRHIRFFLFLYVVFLIVYWTWPGFNYERPPQVQAYVDQFGKTAIQVGWDTGVPPAIILAVGALESGWGQSKLALEGKNHFGMKGKGSAGAKYCSGTREYIRGKAQRITACFRAYDTVEESYRDFADWLRQDERYAGLFNYSWQDYESWAQGLQDAGYATDPAYAKKLVRVVEKYHLHRVD